MEVGLKGQSCFFKIRSFLRTKYYFFICKSIFTITGGVYFSNTHGLPRWLSGEIFAWQCGRWGSCKFEPWIGQIPWRRKWQPTPVFLPGKFHGQRNLVGSSPWGHRVQHDWAAEQLCTHTYIYTQKSEFTKCKLRKWFLFVAQSCKHATVRRRAFLAKGRRAVEGKVEAFLSCICPLWRPPVNTACTLL